MKPYYTPTARERKIARYCDRTNRTIVVLDAHHVYVVSEEPTVRVH